MGSVTKDMLSQWSCENGCELKHHFDHLVLDCGISIADAMEIPQFGTK